MYLPKRLLQTKVLEKERGLLTGVFHGIRMKILPCVAGHLTTFDIGGSQIPHYAPVGGLRGFTFTSALKQNAKPEAQSLTTDTP